MTGTIDAGGRFGGPVTSNKQIPGEIYRSGLPTAQRLQAAGISWKVYQQKDNYECNMLEFFKAFKEAGHSSPLYQRGMVREPEGRFEDDARHDRLPAVSWIIPTSVQCEHPDFIPAAGADFVASKLDAIAANPAVWAKTAVIINYDENDGLFRPRAASGAASGNGRRVRQAGAHRRRFSRAVRHCVTLDGGRLELCSESLDHTSVLRFLEKWTGVAEPNISAWRRKSFGDMTSAFRFDAPAAARPPRLPETAQAAWCEH